MTADGRAGRAGAPAGVTSGGAAPRARAFGADRSGRLLPYVLVLPAGFLVLLLQVYPTLAGIWYAFHDVHLARLFRMPFVGFRNFEHILTGPFPNLVQPVALVTVVWVVGSVVLQVGAGLGLALLLQQRWVRGRHFLRSLYLFPWVIAGIVVGYSWRFIFDPTVGLLNGLLAAAGLSPRAWLVSGPLAMAALLIATTWRHAGYSLVLQMGGLQTISDEVYEAARIDGATGRALLTHIVLPLIRPFLLINLITSTVDALNTFDLVLALTRGGPLYRTETVAMYMYHQGFQWGFLGDAAAVSVIVYGVAILLTIAYVRLLHEREAL